MKKSKHQKRCEEFMKKAGQTVRTKPTIPPEAERLLWATLLLEECLETILDLGFAVRADGHDVLRIYKADKELSLEHIADNLTDVDVIVKCAMSACGLSDEPLFEEVDKKNLEKFELPVCKTKNCSNYGKEMKHIYHRHYSCPSCNSASKQGPYRREDGKWVKPLYWKEPEIGKVLGISYDKE